MSIENFSNEEWRPVKEFEGLYEVSSYGRVRSMRHIDSMGRVQGGGILSIINSSGWYLTVRLHNGCFRKTHRIHRMVYESFIGEIPKGFHIHHVNGNKQDNRVENLKLVTAKEHFQEDIDTRNYKGMNYYNKYVRPRKVAQYTKNNELVAIYNNGKEASKSTGVCARNILQVANKTPNEKGCIRKSAGGYIWKFVD